MFTRQGKRGICRPRRRLLVRGRMVAVATGLLALALLSEPAAAHADATPAVGHDCHEFAGMPDVPYAAAEELVPDAYTVRRDDAFGDLDDPLADTVKLLVTARRCQSLTVGDEGVDDVIDTYIAVPIYTPGVETFCAERLDPNSCRTVPGEPAPNKGGVTPLDPTVSPIDEALPLETYVVQWVTNKQLRATWLRRGIGLGDDVTLAREGLTFDYDPAPCCLIPDAVNFRVTVPSSAPSPFKLEARVTEPGGLPWYAGQNQWWDGEDGTAIIFAEAPVFYFGLQDGGKITSSDRSSPLGRTFGDRQDRLMGGDGDKGIAFDAFSFNFYEEGRWSKCIRDGDQGPCADNHD